MRGAMALGRTFTVALAALALAPAPARAGRASWETPVSTTVDASSVETAPGERGTVRAELVIEAELGGGSAVLVERVRVRGEALLRQREVLPARDGAGSRIVIRIERIGSEPGYTCHFAAYRGEVVVANSDGVSLCKLCTEAELVDHIEAAIDRVVPKLPEEPAVARQAPLPAVQSPKPAPLAPLGKAGIGVGVAGLVAAVAGAVLITRPTEVRDSGLERSQTDFRRPGIAVLSVGLAAMIAGLAMLAVDRHRAKPRAGGVARWGPTAVRF